MKAALPAPPGALHDRHGQFDTEGIGVPLGDGLLDERRDGVGVGVGASCVGSAAGARNLPLMFQLLHACQAKIRTHVRKLWWGASCRQVSVTIKNDE